ncbi:hypothetical protein EPN87_04225 [archaeon]|nr:MAG: hypothetical protein EPN87_04225 [archaeon]
MYWKEIQAAFNFARQVLLKPDKALRKTMNVRDATVYTAIISVVSAVLTPAIYLLAPMMMSFDLSVFYGSMMGLYGLVFIPVFIILSVTGAFLSAGIIHLFGRLFKILPKNFDRTYDAVVYGRTPSLLLGWIPVVNMIAGIWGVVLLIMGLKRQHNITTGKAILAFLAPIIITVAIAMAIAAALVPLYVSTGMMG